MPHSKAAEVRALRDAIALAQREVVALLRDGIEIMRTVGYAEHDLDNAWELLDAVIWELDERE